ncbi:MAG: peptide chain release factor 1 [Candidatus Diapherotrites archaeon]|nr:peptide chain release factor 1 [Candidatus Diapherotrites archaeon]
MSESMSKTKLKKILKHLSEMQGQGTELISLYIPPKYPRSDIMNQLTTEVGQAGNIKSARTRKAVQGALNRIINWIKTTDYKIPENGIAIFSGTLERDAGGEKIELYTIVPPEPVTSRIYRCDSEFYLQPLLEHLESKEKYAIAVIDKTEGTIALLHGKGYRVIYKSHSTIPGKTRAGGQSAPRFQRIRDLETHAWYKKMSEKMNEIFFPMKNELTGIIIGGPGYTKEEWINSEMINPELRAKIIGFVNTGYTDENGIREVLGKADEIIEGAEITQEKKLLGNFLQEAMKTNGMAVYGPHEVEEALKNGQVETLIISEILPWIVYKLKCESCGTEKEITSKNKSKLPKLCPCGGEWKIVHEWEYADHLEKLAEESGTKIETVSAETDEGKQFLDGFGGIGAILRYKLR